MGCRIGSLLADLLYLDHFIQGVVCLGFSFCPFRKPEHLRASHLKSPRAQMLIGQGERDLIGGLKEAPNYDLSKQIKIRWIPDGDHSFSPRKRSGLSDDQNLQNVVRCVDAFMTDVCSG